MWIKNLRLRKLQTVLIFLIIAVSTTLLAGAISILTSLEKPSQDFAKACKSASIKVYTNSEDDDEIYALGEQFLKVSNVKRVEYIRSHFIQENLILNGEKAELFADLTEYDNSVFGTSVYLEGIKTAGKLLADDECILPACISNEYNLHIGDPVIIQLEDTDVTYKVAAVYTDPYQTSTAFDSDILVKKLPAVDSRTIIYVYGKENVTGSQIVETFREKNDGILKASTFTLEERISNGLTVGQIIGALFLAIGIIMLLISALMIHYMINNAIMSDAKSIAVYKTMGYKSNDILLMYLKFYFALVTLACVVGMICSVFISNLILSSIFENMGQLRVNHSILSGVLCYLVVVSFVLSVITLIIMKTKRVKPVVALNGLDYGGVKKKKRYKGNSSLRFSAIGIAYRTFVREKRNAVNIIITCIVTIFGINFIVISLDVANLMKENNDYWIGIDKSDVVVNVVDTENYDTVKNVVENDSRVDYCLNSSYQNIVSLKWKRGMSETNMCAFVYDDYNIAKLPVSEGRNPESGNEIAISTTMTKALHKNIGDYLEIYLNGEQKADMLITGIFHTYFQFGDMCRLTTAAYKEHGVKLDYNIISAYLKDSKDLVSFIDDMKIKIGSSGNVVKRTEQYNSIMNSIVKPQQKAIPPVAALIVLIAGINIFSIVYLKNMRSKKINGIYKCIGYSTWHLILSNLYYVAAIALVSIIVTFPISLMTYSQIMRLSLSMFNFSEYPMQINIGHLIIANVTVLVVFIASTIASSKVLFKVSARDLIQE